jgi:hypothetical protein
MIHAGLSFMNHANHMVSLPVFVCAVVLTLHICITTPKPHTMNNMNYNIKKDSTVPRSMVYW